MTFQSNYTARRAVSLRQLGFLFITASS